MKKLIDIVYDASLLFAAQMSVACLIAYLLGQLFANYYNLPLPYIDALWCVISAVVVMQDHRDQTLKAGFGRLKGSLLGAFVSAIYLTLFGVGLWVFFLICFSLIVIASLVQIQEELRLGVLSAAVIYAVSVVSHPSNYWVTSFDRLLESVIGIVVALVIVWPMEPVHQWVERTYRRYKS